MQKQAPTAGRIFIMVAFALSCFGLLLFLWLSFGGPIPLKPKAYRFQAAFPEAAQLAEEADVRVAGVEVGKVRDKRRSANRTIATIEIDRRYAPVGRDATVKLRQKTLLGETYVQLDLGDEDSPKLPEGGLLEQRNVQEQVELDEILNALDPYTRKAFRTWQQSVADAVEGRGQDLNDTLGNLPGFVETGADLFQTLDQERRALSALVRNTGVVFGAITEREDQLDALIRNSDTVFSAIAAEREDFAETWRIFPTFLSESRATFRRLESFSRSTRPFVRDMEPALRDLGPTLDAVGDFSPDLKRLFINLDPLLEISERSLPASAEVFRGLRPLLGELGPWLGELNPILDWIGHHSHTLSDIFANLGVALQAKTDSRDPRATGHYLRQFGPSGAETVAVYPRRLGSNRGNSYFNPLALTGPGPADRGALPAWDCDNAGGEKPPTEGAQGSPACWVQGGYPAGPAGAGGGYPFQGRLTRFPQVHTENYAQPPGR